MQNKARQQYLPGSWCGVAWGFVQGPHMVYSSASVFCVCYPYRIVSTIVNRGKWLGSPANIKGANKEAKIEVGMSMTVHIFCFALI